MMVIQGMIIVEGLQFDCCVEDMFWLCYLDIVEGKMVQFFCWVLQWGVCVVDVFVEMCEYIGNFVCEFGLVFQMIDDYFDLVVSSFCIGKDCCIDFVNG